MSFQKNKDKGIAYSEYVTEKLKAAGYQVYGELVNFADYGIPQKRVRFILIGIQKEIAGNNKLMAKSFFERLQANVIHFCNEKNIAIDTTLEDAISDLLMANGTYQAPDMPKFKMGIYKPAKTQYQQFLRQDVQSINPDSHRFANHSQAIISKFTAILATSRRNKDLEQNLRELYNIKKHTIIPLDGQTQCPTITTLPDDYIHYCEPRILTVREYARIQSFPDNFEFKGKYTTGGKVRTQEVPRYSQIGNAIPPLFSEQSGIILQQMI